MKIAIFGLSSFIVFLLIVCITNGGCSEKVSLPSQEVGTPTVQTPPCLETRNTVSLSFKAPGLWPPSAEIRKKFNDLSSTERTILVDRSLYLVRAIKADLVKLDQLEKEMLACPDSAETKEAALREAFKCLFEKRIETMSGEEFLRVGFKEAQRERRRAYNDVMQYVQLAHEDRLGIILQGEYFDLHYEEEGTCSRQ